MHIFLCTLAYYAEWHTREALRELMFADEDLERKKRIPSAPTKNSRLAMEGFA